MCSPAGTRGLAPKDDPRRLGAIRSASVRHPTASADAATLRQLERIEEYLEARGYLTRRAAKTSTR